MLTNNIPNIMTPGMFAEYNYFAGPNGLPANVQKLLLIGDVTSEGSLEVAKATDVYSETDVIAAAGAGSILHQMYLSAKKAWKYAKITLLRHAAVTGSAASWTIEITISGASAVKSGLAKAKIGTELISVGYAVGATEASIIASLVDAINDKTELCVTAAIDSEDTSKAVLTAKSSGAYISSAQGGLIVSAESTTEDIDFAITSVAGVGDVDIESALTAVFAERYHLIATSICDADNLALLKTHLENAASSLEMRGQRSISVFVTPSVSAVNTVKTLAEAVNHERVHIAALKNKVLSPAWDIASALGAIFTSNSQPNKPMNWLPIPNIAIPAVEDKWNNDECEALLYAGVIPLKEEDNSLCIVRAVTTKSSNNGSRFTKLIDTGVIASLDYTRDSIIQRQKEKFKNAVIHELLPDAINEENISVCKDLETALIHRFVDDNIDQFITEESADEPGRVLCQIPAGIVPGLNQIMNSIDLYLN